jgi:hypothetical protein
MISIQAFVNQQRSSVHMTIMEKMNMCVSLLINQNFHEAKVFSLLTYSFLCDHYFGGLYTI